MPNVELLRKTLAHIEAHPQTWFQATWAELIEGAAENECGTAFCFGGWAAVLHGATITVDDAPDGVADVLVTPPPGEPANRYDPAADHWDEIDIHAYARGVLGLTYEQGVKLFDGFNTLDDLRRIVSELCEGGS